MNPLFFMVFHRIHVLQFTELYPFRKRLRPPDEGNTGIWEIQGAEFQSWIVQIKARLILSLQHLKEEFVTQINKASKTWEGNVPDI